MSESIVQQDIATLLDGWINAERDGVQFPVPFDLAWNIAGYSMKHHGKRKLLAPKSRLVEGVDYLTRLGESSPEGRSSDLIKLTCDAFKAFCLLAETQKGDEIRQYFIESEKKWKLVQEVAPEIAQEVELMAMRIELAKIEAQKAVAESEKANSEHQLAIAQNNLLSFRHLVTTTMPEVKQKIILGFEVVEKIEYRDRIIQNNQVLDDGETINKTDLCQRYDIKTRSGAPDYKRLNALLNGARLPDRAWEETTTIRSNTQLRREFLEPLDRHILSGNQQMYCGE
jgi:phage anti-repressor protein